MGAFANLYLLLDTGLNIVLMNTYEQIVTLVIKTSDCVGGVNPTPPGEYLRNLSLVPRLATVYVNHVLGYNNVLVGLWSLRQSE